MRSSACDTLTRLCVRHVLCWFALPLVSALRSTSSAAEGAAFSFRYLVGYARLFEEHTISIDVENPAELVLFPEIDPRVDVPEITTACWDVLGKSAADVMCASSRMIVKRKGSERPVVVACTLLPYDQRFELGPTLGEAKRSVQLNHPNCAKFCVLGGASCSAR
jgi:hypothetical protein